MTAQVVDRRRWSRLVLTLPPELHADLRTLAAAHFRDGKREALRLLAEGVERELGDARSGAGVAER